MARPIISIRERSCLQGLGEMTEVYYYFSSKMSLSTGPRWINNYYIDAEGKRQTGWLVWMESLTTCTPPPAKITG